MKGLALALLLLPATATAQTCSDAAECGDCTTGNGCGWCDGTAYVDGAVVSYHCLDKADSWTCDGAFKSTDECDCATGGAPWSLINNGMWRGFSIDGEPALADGEMSIEFGYGTDDWGTATVVTPDGKTSVANVSSIVDCTRGEGCDGDQFFLSFEDDAALPSMACTYKTGWQDGPNAHVLSLGCNITTGTAPSCFDVAEHSLVFWSCLDQSRCSFTAAGAVAAPAAAEEPAVASASFAILVSEEKEEAKPAAADDTCSATGTCAECTAGGCLWCLGYLYDADSNALDGTANCFSHDVGFTCDGTTIADETCAVYKCPWYVYYVDKTGDCSDLACVETTGDDADFVRTDTPAAAYSSAESCQSNCVDPTVGCDADAGTCGQTFACNVSSSCASCTDYDLPTHLAGIELTAGYAAGGHAFDFSDDFTSVTVSPPGGAASWTASISAWLYDAATQSWSGAWTLDATKSVRGARMAVYDGALGKDVYIALGTDTALPAWGQAIAHVNNGTEFALVGCTGTSGRGTAIKCTV